MDPYERQLKTKITGLDERIAELEANIAQLAAQRQAYVEALQAYRHHKAQTSPPPQTAPNTTQTTAQRPAPQTLPDASTRLQAIIAILKKQPEQMMKAGPLKDAVSNALQYSLSRHHVADILRAYPERFHSPRRGYWVLRATEP